MSNEKVQVVALEAGHRGGVYRPLGDKWHMPASEFKDGKHVDGSTWFVPVELAPPPKPPVKNPRPPGAGPLKGSAVVDAEDVPGAGPAAG